MKTRKPGRPRSLEPRSHTVAVTLTAAELAALDESRGKQSRASYVRQLLIESVKQERDHGSAP